MLKEKFYLMILFMLNIFNSVSGNHKIIGISYLWLAYWFGIVGFYMSVLIRTELSMSGLKIITMDTLEIYNLLFTLHGLIMVFFNIMTGLFGGIGNYLYPVLLGSCDVVYPRVNLYSLLLQPIGFVLVVSSVYLEIGSGTGWTLYPPLSTSLSNIGIDFIIFGLLAAGIASTLSSVNFITTFTSIRAVGFVIDRVSPAAWSIILTSFLLLLSLPVVTAVFLMVFLDRHYNTMFFESSNSGDPILYQHLFWFFGHPEVYIMILPGFGIISLLLSTYATKEMFGNQTMILAMGSIALLGCLVWGHHMYTSGLEADTRGYFTTVTILIALPTGNKIFNWVTTLQCVESIRSIGLVLFAVLFVVNFVIGGTTGVVLGNAGVDIALHDTVYVVGHFHFVLSIGAIMSMICFIIYIQRMLFGIIFSNRVILLIAPIFMIAVLFTFLPMHFAGFSPLPRRIPDYPDEMWGWNFICTIGATMMLVLKFAILFIISL